MTQWGPYFPSGGWSLSGQSASGTGTAFDIRASNGNFLVIASAGQNGPSGGASATVFIQHSPDLTAWTNLTQFTASSTGVVNTMLNQWHSAGAYAYVRATITALWSAAQTGTAQISVFILPGNNV